MPTKDNRYAEPVDEDKEAADMEEFFELSAAEQDRAIQKSWRELVEASNQTPPARMQAIRRRNCLRHCMSCRLLLRQHPDWGFLKKMLKEAQMRLVKVRVWRATGHYPTAGH